ncbi:MAG: hypothetical protein H7Z10_13455 [Gemmatimonadaceae bacterium]|nr:hypothetical protein [Acetobacteraceae bacterium]
MPIFAAAFLALPVFASAHAAGFVIEPIGQPGEVAGCVAINAETEVGLVAVDQTLVLIMTSELLRLRKGDAVDGTWQVDNSKERRLDVKTDTVNTVSVELPASKENFALLANGNTVTVTMGATSVEWGLDGSRKALVDLGTCMDKNAKR